MPLYVYQCLDCASCEKRIAGLDDHTALCVRCRGVMLRLDEDIFRPYFDENDFRLETQPSSLGLNQ